MTADILGDPGVLAGAALLVGAIFCSVLAERLRVPGLLLFLGLGMLIGGLGWIELDQPALAQVVGVVALLVILFAGGVTTEPVDLARAALPGVLLATVGVVVTAAVVAGGVYLVLGTSIVTAALIGAVVSSTDAAAVFAIIRKAPLPRRVMSTLEVESGANDPVAIMLTIGVLEWWQADPTAWDLLGFAAVQLGGGLLVGVVFGLAGSAVLNRVHLTAEGLYPLLALGVAGLAYGIAAAGGASGFLAVYVTGILVGVRVPRHRRTIRQFHDGLGSAADIVLFLVLGLLVSPLQLPDVTLPALAIAAVLVLVARPVAVGLCLLGQRFSLPERGLLAWVGLRGAVPIVLATFPFTAGYPQATVIFNVVFFVVLVSAAVQGSTTGLVARMLGLRRHARVWAPVAEALPLEGVEVDFVEVDVTEELPIADQRLRDIPLPAGALLTAVVRRSEAIVPTGETRLRPGDRALVAVSRRPRATDEIIAWARGEALPVPDHPDPPAGHGRPRRRPWPLDGSFRR